MFAQLIFIVFISIMATEYRRNSVCFEIQKPGENNIGIGIDCDDLNKLESNYNNTHKNNQTALDEFQRENLFEIKICKHTQDSSDKCYYTKYYTDLMNEFLEGQNQKKTMKIA